MSDTPGGPNWRIGTGGKWYPPSDGQSRPLPSVPHPTRSQRHAVGAKVWVFIGVLCLVVAGLVVAVVVKSRSNGTASTQAASSAQAASSPTTYQSADDLMKALDTAGVSCKITEPSAGSGGGAATVGFCTLSGRKIQAATFSNESGKSSWFNLASHVAKSLQGEQMACVVGTDWAICPDPGSSATSLSKKIAAVIGGKVQQFSS